MIVIPYEMKKAMNYNTIKLIGKFCPIKRGILSHRIYTDKQVSGETVSLAIIKSNNISIIVVLQIFYIDIKNIIIGAKYNRNIS